MNASFYLSYARADASPQVKRFFDDLCDTIRLMTDLPRSSPVGFFEDTQYQSNSDWSSEAQQALQTSQAMVCLLSPAYFHDSRAGKEWQIFDRRRRLSPAMTAGHAEIIKPICWSRWHGSVPVTVNDLLANPNQFFQQHSIKEMLKPSGGYLSEYAELIKVTAQQLIEMTANSRLGVLTHLAPFRELTSQFQLWADFEVLKPNHEANILKSTLEKDSLRIEPLQINVTVTDTREPASVSVSNREASAPDVRINGSHEAEEYFEPARVFVIEDDEQQRELLQNSLSICGFAVKTFERAETAFHKSLGFEHPDLCLVDMKLAAGTMQGIDFIKKLTDINDVERPSLIAMSGTPSMMEEAIKAGAVRLDKPYELERLITMIRNLANQAKKKRLFNTQSTVDKSRDQRPVFLSFSNDHRRLATGLKSHIEAEDIGVWYSRDRRFDRKPWPLDVNDGIDRADVFLAFITEGFLNSHYCWSELDRFSQRKKRNGDALLLPIFYSSTGLSDRLKLDPRISGAINPADAIDLSGPGFVESIDDIVRRVREKVTHSSAIN